MALAAVWGSPGLPKRTEGGGSVMKSIALSQIRSGCSLGLSWAPQADRERRIRNEIRSVLPKWTPGLPRRTEGGGSVMKSVAFSQNGSGCNLGHFWAPQGALRPSEAGGRQVENPPGPPQMAPAAVRDTLGPKWLWLQSGAFLGQRSGKPSKVKHNLGTTFKTLKGPENCER